MAYSLTGLEISNLTVANKTKLSSLAGKYLKKVTGKIDLGVFKNKTHGYFKATSQYYIVAGVL